MMAFVALSDSEIQAFWNDINANNDEKITFSELEDKPEEIYKELAPKPKKHNPNHPSRSAPSEETERSDLHDFLSKLMPVHGESTEHDEFFAHFKSWNIPSQDQTASKTKKDVDEALEYDKQLTFVRRCRAWWSVKGPEVLFLAFVAALILAFSLWQGFIYALSSEARAAFGWGVVVSKFSAGALYPTLFFMVLSMSRCVLSSFNFPLANFTLAS